MPYYVSVQGMIDRYGEDAVTLASDRENDGDANAEALANAIIDAEGEIDSYLAKVADLPLPGVSDIAAPEGNAAIPAVLRRVACDVAVYRVATDYGGSLTLEKRQRYEDALAWLKMVAEGTVGLGLPTAPPAAGGFTVRLSAADRVMTRDKLRGF